MTCRAHWWQLWKPSHDLWVEWRRDGKSQLSMLRGSLYILALASLYCEIRCRRCGEVMMARQIG